MPPSRREVLKAIGGLAGASAARAWPRQPARPAVTATRSDPADTCRAEDESFWSQVAAAFPVDRSLLNLDHARTSPAPAIVLDALERHLAFSNQAPAYSMWQILEPQREAVRQRLAAFSGVDPEEIAITRNTSEGLQAVQFGFDLGPGDEVLTTTQDYPRMIETFQQRECREGIMLRQIELPVPCDDDAAIVGAFESAITERTRLILACHMLPLTGAVLPVQQITALGRSRGIPVLIDGAHAFAHLDVAIGDLDCDVYATSLHKWLSAPVGTGLLFVRKDLIPRIWPLMAAPESMADGIRKFEEIGTHPAANALAVAEALTFHEGIGSAAKLARLVFLRDRWAKPLLQHERVRMHTNLEPGRAGGIATFEIEGIDPRDLKKSLWDRHGIVVRAARHRLNEPGAGDAFQGIRVSPGVPTTIEEVDRFVAAIEDVLDDGV